MLRRSVPVVAVLLLLARPAADVRAAGETPFGTIWATYQTGDYAVVGRAIQTLQQYQVIRSDLISAMNSWKRDWQRIHAMFLIDLIKTEVDHRWFYLQTRPSRDLTQEIVVRSVEFVTQRRQKIGADPELDRFEILWHRTAFALLQTNLAGMVARDYLDAVKKRYVSEPASNGAPRLVDPQVALMAALIKEEWTLPDTLADLQGQMTSSLMIDRPNGAARRNIDDTLEAFEAAAVHPEVAAEANVRRGFLLYRLGRTEEALSALGQAGAAPADPAVTYWRALFSGRAHDAAGDTDAAEQALRDAHAAWPSAQSPLVALAVLYQKAGRRSEALAVVRQLRELPAGAVDPWWTYWYGDARHVNEWLAELRRMAR
jgi:tetratricopeptide (TPR) repeat protein